MKEQVSRDSSLKIPKEIEVIFKCTDKKEEKLATMEAVATAKNQKFDSMKVSKKLDMEDKDLEVISKIPTNANDLIVVTVVKKLTAYIITITEKSSKKFRNVFVCRMQNYCLDILESLLQANFNPSSRSN